MLKHQLTLFQLAGMLEYFAQNRTQMIEFKHLMDDKMRQGSLCAVTKH